MSHEHPRLFSADVFYPKTKEAAASYLREIADLLDAQDKPPYHSAVEQIVVEFNSGKDSPTADVVIRLRLRNMLGEEPQ